jgi:hypothetical protein
MPADPRIIGTSLRGYVHASYDDLVAHFGQPEPSPDGKCRARWIVSTPYGWGTVYDMTGEEPNAGSIESNISWHIGARNDETADDICAQLRNGGTYVQPTRYEVCALPPHFKAWRHFVVDVEYRGEGKWAVIRNGMCLDKNGHRQYEPSSSNRTDEFLERYRHTLDDALAIARREAPRVTVNRFTVADALANGPEWV